MSAIAKQKRGLGNYTNHIVLCTRARKFLRVSLKMRFIPYLMIRFISKSCIIKMKVFRTDFNIS